MKKEELELVWKQTKQTFQSKLAVLKQNFEILSNNMKQKYDMKHVDISQLNLSTSLNLSEMDKRNI